MSQLRARKSQQGTIVHPGDLDGALQLGIVTSDGGGAETRLPFAVDEACLGGAEGTLWAVVEQQRGAEAVGVWLGVAAGDAQAVLERLVGDHGWWRERVGWSQRGGPGRDSRPGRR